MKYNDPAYWMLEKGKQEAQTTPNKFDWRSKVIVYKKGCYICEDTDFALMGLPLCYVCNKCGGHVAADDTICDDCGEDQQT